MEDSLRESYNMCCICFNTNNLTDIHDNAHNDVICESCKSLITTCPICRKILKSETQIDYISLHVHDPHNMHNQLIIENTVQDSCTTVQIINAISCTVSVIIIIGILMYF